MIGKLLGNRYEIMEKIGTGGMGDVYKAHCHKLDRIVAIKILKKEYNGDNNFIRKFKRESLAAASISHPNIVSIYDVGTEVIDDSDVHYIVMEYIDGKTLKEIISETGRLKKSRALSYTVQICEALKTAHQKGIIHRDIKSQNIMVTKDDRVKVTDFGIARIVDSATVTATNAIMGSVHYFSPEQARGSKVDNRSDIYSLGIVLYEMLTGKLPFEAENPVTVALMQVQTDMPRPSLLNPEVDEDVDNLVLNMTWKKPEDRYRDASEIIRAIKDILLGRTVTAHQNNADTSDRTVFMPTDNINREARKKVVRRSPESQTYDRPNYEREYTMPPSNKRQQNKSGVGSILLGMLAALIIFVALIFVVPKVWNSNNTGNNTEITQGEQVKVPSFKGMQSDKAYALAKELGFVLKLGEPKSDPNFRNQEIVSQDVEFGTMVPKGTEITLVINNIDKKDLPNLVGKTLEEAQELIKDRGFEADIQFENSNDVEENTVISQYPEAGEKLEQGGKVSIKVSKGLIGKQVEVPALKGISESSAIATLKAKGLQVGSVTKGRTNDVGVGEVFEQSIKSGESVPAGTVVDLTISEGPIIKEEPPKENNEPIQEEPQRQERVSKKVTLPFQLPNDGQSHEILVKVLENGNERNIYKEVKNGDGGSFEVTIEGRVGQTYKVYMNNDLIDTLTIQ